MRSCALNNKGSHRGCRRYNKELVFLIHSKLSLLPTSGGRGEKSHSLMVWSAEAETILMN